MLPRRLHLVYLHASSLAPLEYHKLSPTGVSGPETILDVTEITPAHTSTYLACP